MLEHCTHPAAHTHNNTLASHSLGNCDCLRHLDAVYLKCSYAAKKASEEEAPADDGDAADGFTLSGSLADMKVGVFVC